MAAILVEILKHPRGVMKIRSAVAVVVAVAGLSLSATVYAAPTVSSHVYAMFAKSQTVKVSLRNDSGSPLELKVGDQVVSLDAGKTVALKLAIGTRIVVNAATSKHKAGEVLAEASSALDNATLAIT
jgi:hypothetical protein